MKIPIFAILLLLFIIPTSHSQDSPMFKAVEEMPRFPGCERKRWDITTKKQCADAKFQRFIAKNLRYPDSARELGVQGIAVVSFIVMENGFITNVLVLKDPGAGLGEEAKRIITEMNKMPKKWIPGKQEGKPVAVKFNMPINFRLQ